MSPIVKRRISPPHPKTLHHNFSIENSKISIWRTFKIAIVGIDNRDGGGGKVTWSQWIFIQARIYYFRLDELSKPRWGSDFAEKEKNHGGDSVYRQSSRMSTKQMRSRQKSKRNAIESS